MLLWARLAQYMVVSIGRRVQLFCSSWKSFICTVLHPGLWYQHGKQNKPTKQKKMDVTGTLKKYAQPPFVSEDTRAIMVVISRLTQLLNEKARSVISNQTNPLYSLCHSNKIIIEQYHCLE